MVISISNSLFAASAGTQQAISPQQSAQTPTENVQTTNADETVKTDNIQPGTQIDATAKQPDSFSQTLSKKMSAKDSTDEKEPVNEKTEKQDDNSEATSKAVCPAEYLIPQAPVTGTQVQNQAVDVKVENLLQQQITNQIPDKSVQLPTDPETSPLSSLITQATEPVVTQVATQPDTAIPAPKNEPVQPNIDQGQVKPEMVIPDTPDKSPIDTKNSTDAVSTAAAGESKITSDSKKTTKTDTPTDQLAAETILPVNTDITSTQPSNQQNDKETKPQILISDNKTPSVVTIEPIAADSPKTQVPNIQITAPVSQTQTAEETSSDKADTSQKDSGSKTEFSDLLENNKLNIETISVKPVSQNIIQSQIQPVAKQADNNKDLVSSKPVSGSDIELGKQQIISNNNIQPVITDHSSASTAPAKISGSAVSGANISSQVQESIHSSFNSGGQQIVIHLNPPELGKVAIKFTEEGNSITGILQVDKPQTKDQIQQSLPDIIRNLQDSGIQIKKLEVVLTGQQDQYTPKDQSSSAGQNGWSGQQSSSNPQSHGNSTFYSGQPAVIDNYTDFAENRMQYADDSINMLA
jgi:hypothetical protein